MKLIRNIGIPVSTALLLMSCAETVTEKSDNSKTPMNNNSELVRDSVGDISSSAFDISGAQYQLFTDSILITISLDSLPDSLRINKATTPDNYLEYEFSATFDIANDGNQENDIVLSAKHFKFPGEIEVVDAIENCFQSHAWDLASTGGSSLCAIHTTYCTNSVVLSVNRSAHERLNDIAPNTKLTVSTIVYEDSVVESDTLVIE